MMNVHLDFWYIFFDYEKRINTRLKFKQTKMLKKIELNNTQLHDSDVWKFTVEKRVDIWKVNNSFDSVWFLVKRELLNKINDWL